MPVLVLDPNKAIRPDFASQDYVEVHNGMISEDIDKEVAIVLLVNAWNVNNAVEKVIWARQRRKQEDAQRENERQAQEENEQRMAVRGLEEEAARNKERKKYKNKYMDVSMAPPPMTPPKILSAYATTCLQKGLYVELWYFTNEGLDYALKTSTALDDDTVVQSIDKDGNAIWVTAAASKGSKTVQDNKNLLWEQLLVMIPRFLDAIHAAGWTNQRQDMMARLFMGLQAHPYRLSRDPLDRTTLLKYLSEQRRLWHQALDTGTGAWNIGLLSESLICAAGDSVHKEFFDQREAERNRMVSQVSLREELAC
ncbi:hypothetical protein C0992_002437 [Termitomyces sp. T32_za158]|nr:hypothetical protein C0992_002437 [Termitomyces sp. T32_za158]